MTVVVQGLYRTPAQTHWMVGLETRETGPGNLVYARRSDGFQTHRLY